MENGKEVLAKVVQLRTQLVSQGHTRHLLAETDLMTLRIEEAYLAIKAGEVL